MQQKQTQLDIVTSPISATYTTDSMRKVKDEDGSIRTARMEETRQVVPTLTIDKEGGRVFHRGARIA